MASQYTPVIIGVSQYTQKKDALSPLDPMGLMTIASKSALKDARDDDLKKYVDTIRIVNIFSYSYRDAGKALAENLEIFPSHTYYSTIGGNTPQLYVNKAAEEITTGRSKMTLIAGAEAGYSVRRAHKGDIILDWPGFDRAETLDGEERDGGSAHEFLYDTFIPTYSYALFENAFRYAKGLDIDTHRTQIGDICARLSKVAAQNPYAWIQEEKTTEQIITPSSSNRYIGFPYTLNMCANLNVDQAAAVILTSEEFAQALGIPSEKWIYPMGGATLHNVWNISRRPDLHTSPALKQAGRLALDQAGLAIDEIDVFDFYNCFPCAVEIATQAFGLEEDDQRPITLTGGLAYFGGPGNNYSLHAIANVVDHIRVSPEEKALVTALGWYNTKWSVGIYGKEKGKNPWIGRDDRAVQARLNSKALPEPVEEADGPLTVESYVVVYEKSGTPHHMTVLGRLENNRRAFAFVVDTPEALKRFESVCPIGKKGMVQHDAKKGCNLIIPGDW